MTQSTAQKWSNNGNLGGGESVRSDLLICPGPDASVETTGGVGKIA